MNPFFHRTRLLAHADLAADIDYRVPLSACRSVFTICASVNLLVRIDRSPQSPSLELGPTVCGVKNVPPVGLKFRVPRLNPTVSLELDSSVGERHATRREVSLHHTGSAMS